VCASRPLLVWPPKMGKRLVIARTTATCEQTNGLMASTKNRRNFVREPLRPGCRSNHGHAAGAGLCRLWFMRRGAPPGRGCDGEQPSRRRLNPLTNCQHHGQNGLSPLTVPATEHHYGDQLG
jgi:hypothetical protein